MRAHHDADMEAPKGSLLGSDWGMYAPIGVHLGGTCAIATRLSGKLENETDPAKMRIGETSRKFREQ